jgi:hypothetical protein
MRKKTAKKKKITFALVADVAVILGNDIAGGVLHERLVNNLFVVVGPLLLPQGAQAGRSKRTGVAGQLNPRRAPVLQQDVGGRRRQIQRILNHSNKISKKINNQKLCLFRLQLVSSNLQIQS